MQQYESYRDSGVVWLGDVPSHWEVQPLRSVTKLKADRNRPELPVLSVYREYGVILKDSRDDNHNATSLDTSAYKSVKPGDLVVNKMKAWQGSMGVSPHEGIVSPAYITCATNADRVRPAYLHYLLRSAPLIGVYNALSYGVRVGQWDMHYEDFKQIQISLPPLAEQDRVVSFLDQKTAELDAAIAKKERLIELLQEQKSILINQAVTRGLNHDVPMRDSGVEWIGTTPAHWSIKRAKYLFREIDERSQAGDEELLSVSHLTGVTPRSDKNNIYMFMAEDYSGSKLCRSNDLVFNIMWAWMGALGVSNQVGIVSPSYGVYRQLVDGTFNSWYLEHLLRSSSYVAEYNRRSTGLHSSRLRLYSNMFFDMEIAYPSRAEQDEIEYFTKEQVALTETVISATTLEIEKLIELRATLVASVVTGKLKA
ncbi:MAG: restriction endonuclease subunit S [Pseudomonadota bacterium]